MFEKLEDQPRTADGRLRNPWLEAAGHALIASLVQCYCAWQTVRVQQHFGNMAGLVMRPIIEPVEDVLRENVAARVAEGAFDDVTPEDVTGSNAADDLMALLRKLRGTP